MASSSNYHNQAGDVNTINKNSNNNNSTSSHHSLISKVDQDILIRQMTAPIQKSRYITPMLPTHFVNQQQQQHQQHQHQQQSSGQLVGNFQPQDLFLGSSPMLIPGQQQQIRPSSVNTINFNPGNFAPPAPHHHHQSFMENVHAAAAAYHTPPTPGTSYLHHHPSHPSLHAPLPAYAPVPDYFMGSHSSSQLHPAPSSLYHRRSFSVDSTPATAASNTNPSSSSALFNEQEQIIVNNSDSSKNNKNSNNNSVGLARSMSAVNGGAESSGSTAAVRQRALPPEILTIGHHRSSNDSSNQSPTSAPILDSAAPSTAGAGRGSHCLSPGPLSAPVLNWTRENSAAGDGEIGSGSINRNVDVATAAANNLRLMYNQAGLLGTSPLDTMFQPPLAPPPSSSSLAHIDPQFQQHSCTNSQLDLFDPRLESFLESPDFESLTASSSSSSSSTSSSAASSRPITPLSAEHYHRQHRGNFPVQYNMLQTHPSLLSIMNQQQQQQQQLQKYPQYPQQMHFQHQQQQQEHHQVKQEQKQHEDQNERLRRHYNMAAAAVDEITRNSMLHFQQQQHHHHSSSNNNKQLQYEEPIMMMSTEGEGEISDSFDVNNAESPSLLSNTTNKRPRRQTSSSLSAVPSVSSMVDNTNNTLQNGTVSDIHSHIDSNGRRIFTCMFSGCSKTYGTGAGLRYHLHTVHNSPSPRFMNRPDIMYPCDMCSKSYVTRSGLKYHKIRSGHSDANGGGGSMAPVSSRSAGTPLMEFVTAEEQDISFN